jgi:hypothetical protein
MGKLEGVDRVDPSREPRMLFLSPLLNSSSGKQDPVFRRPNFIPTYGMADEFLHMTTNRTTIESWEAKNAKSMEESPP